MKRLFRKLQIRAYYWYLINTNDIKYSFLLDIYTKILPRKFKMDQKVVYKNHVWSVYYTGRSYRPYYYHLSRIGHGRFIYTSMAEEQDLKPLSPVMEAMYEGVDV